MVNIHGQRRFFVSFLKALYFLGILFTCFVTLILHPSSNRVSTSSAAEKARERERAKSTESWPAAGERAEPNVRSRPTVWTGGGVGGGMNVPLKQTTGRQEKRYGRALLKKKKKKRS